VLQIVKRPNNKQAFNVDARFKLLTKVKRERKELEVAVEEVKKDKKDAKKKDQEHVEPKEPEWEFLPLTRWIIEAGAELEVLVNFYSKTLGTYSQELDFLLQSSFET